MDKRKGPNFICLGAQKSGTTWLYECLKHHPQIQLTPIKELHYFDELQMKVSSSLGARLFNRKHWRHQMWRRRIRNYFTHQPLRNWIWGFHYFLKKRDADWYAQLFRPGPGQITGDLTPNYSILQHESAKELIRLIPDVKIVLMLRSPVDRMWSACKMHMLQRGMKDFSEVKAVDVLSYFSEEENLYRSRYAQILNVWRSLIPEERIWIGFYDQIEAEPQVLLSSLFNFLEVPGVSIPEPVLHRVVKKGVYFPLPKSIEAASASYFLRELEELEMFLEGQSKKVVKDWKVGLSTTIANSIKQ